MGRRRSVVGVAARGVLRLARRGPRGRRCRRPRNVPSVAAVPSETYVTVVTRTYCTDGTRRVSGRTGRTDCTPTHRRDPTVFFKQFPRFPYGPTRFPYGPTRTTARSVDTAGKGAKDSRFMVAATTRQQRHRTVARRRFHDAHRDAHDAHSSAHASVGRTTVSPSLPSSSLPSSLPPWPLPPPPLAPQKGHCVQNRNKPSAGRAANVRIHASADASYRAVGHKRYVRVRNRERR